MNKGFRIGGALLLGGGIILVSVYLRFSPEQMRAATITAVANSATRSYIAYEDRDRDGTSDWEEDIHGVSKNVMDDLPEFSIDGADGSSDDTLTSSFGRAFFEEYLHRSILGPVSDEQVEELVSDHVTKLEHDTQDELYTYRDIKTGENTAAAERTYGNALAELIILYGSNDYDNEIDLFARALSEQDNSAREDLGEISAAYRVLEQKTLQVPVPTSLADAHLLLVNAYRAIAENTAAFAASDEDPIRALVRMRRHPQDTAAMMDAFSRIYLHLHESGVRYAADEPASIVRVPTN